jgi:hypothetical protein
MRIMLSLLGLVLLATLIAGCVDSEGGGPTSPTTATATSSPTSSATSIPQPTATPPEPSTVTPTATAEPVTSTPISTPATQRPTPTPTSVAPLTLRLRVGESGDAGDGWTLRFDAVENDSRCGVDVVCVWAGEATVVLTATSPSGEASEVRIVLAPGEGTGAVGGLGLRAYDLLPKPRSTERIDPSDYVVSIEVTRG